MHTVQNLPPKLRHVFAPHAKSSPKTEACFCTVCINVSQFSGWSLKFWDGFSRIWDKVFKFLDDLSRIWDMPF